jgi:protein gp37
MNQLLDIEAVEIIESMTADEARQQTESIRKGVRDIETRLFAIYERQGWKALGYRSMNQYMIQEFPEFSKGQLYKKLQAARTKKNLKEVPMGTSLPERALRPIATNEFIEQPRVQREIIEIAIDISDDGKPTSADVQQAKTEYRRKTSQVPRSTFNEVNENIEWAAWSWNPVTGCKHGCEYCYARDIANRFYPQGFEPTYHPERITAPYNMAVPNPRWRGDFGYNAVFVCSMADLFGKWVPKEWIDAVLDSIEANPQWTFLLLTKFPVRMAEFMYPPNVWLGTTVDKQWTIDRAVKGFSRIKTSGFSGVCWLSCEPMLERLTFPSLEMFDWLVMGGASKSSQTPEYRPPFDDIVHLHKQARGYDVPIYQKTNLIPGMSDEQRLREYPHAVQILD